MGSCCQKPTDTALNTEEDSSPTRRQLSSAGGGQDGRRSTSPLGTARETNISVGPGGSGAAPPNDDDTASDRNPLALGVEESRPRSSSSRKPAPATTLAAEEKPIYSPPQPSVVLSETDFRIIIETWSLINGDLHALGRELYRLLFATAPDVKEGFFKRTNLEAQALSLAKMCDELFQLLRDSPDKAYETLLAIGERHVRYRVEAVHYPVFGSVLAQALVASLGDKFTPEVQRAWGMMIALIISTCQEGSRTPKACVFRSALRDRDSSRSTLDDDSSTEKIALADADRPPQQGQPPDQGSGEPCPRQWSVSPCRQKKESSRTATASNVVVPPRANTNPERSPLMPSNFTGCGGGFTLQALEQLASQQQQQQQVPSGGQGSNLRLSPRTQNLQMWLQELKVAGADRRGTESELFQFGENKSSDSTNGNQPRVFSPREGSLNQSSLASTSFSLQGSLKGAAASVTRSALD